MIACESTEKQGSTNPLELYNMTLEDDIECINYQSDAVAESDNEVLENSGSQYFPSEILRILAVMMTIHEHYLNRRN